VRSVATAILLVVVSLPSAGLGSGLARQASCTVGQSVSTQKRASEARSDPLRRCSHLRTEGTRNARPYFAAPRPVMNSAMNSANRRAETKNPSQVFVSRRPTQPTDARTRDNAGPTQALQGRPPAEGP
jgi:hypothetical protein